MPIATHKSGRGVCRCDRGALCSSFPIHPVGAPVVQLQRTPAPGSAPSSSPKEEGRSDAEREHESMRVIALRAWHGLMPTFVHDTWCSANGHDLGFNYACYLRPLLHRIASCEANGVGWPKMTDLSSPVTARNLLSDPACVATWEVLLIIKRCAAPVMLTRSYSSCSHADTTVQCSMRLSYATRTGLFHSLRSVLPP